MIAAKPEKATIAAMFNETICMAFDGGERGSGRRVMMADGYSIRP